MATATTLVPLETYLNTSYEHDCEWVDGELRERGMPDECHSAIQAFFLFYFETRKRELGVRVRAELRFRISTKTYRIPDVALLRADAPFTPIALEPPLLCIEILSPDDRATELHEKVAEYLAMGTANVWIVDPRRRTMAYADKSGFKYVSEFRLTGTNVAITAAELFAEIDELEARTAPPS